MTIVKEMMFKFIREIFLERNNGCFYLLTQIVFVFDFLFAMPQEALLINMEFKVTFTDIKMLKVVFY